MTTVPAAPTTLTIRTPDDILAIVPVTIGFHPTESLVLVTFDSAKNMPPGMPTGPLGGGGFHARVDLPTDPRDIDAAVEPLHQAVRSHRPQLGAVVVYGRDVELGARVGAAAERAFTGEGMQVIETLQVHDGQWWELPGARPRRGWRPQRHDFDVASHPILAERVYAGQVVLADRQALADSLRGTDVADRHRVADAVDRVTDRLCRGIAEQVTQQGAVDAAERVREGEVAWLTALLDDPPPLQPDDVARVLTLALMDSVRDQVCRRLTRRRAIDQLPVWREVVRRAPTELVAGAAGALALVAWLAGDGALAWCAIDRCHEVDPGDTLAEHVAAALQNAVPPSAWDPESVAL